MAFLTNRNNIEPMLRLVAWMMVLFCLVSAIMTFQGTCSNQFASCNSISNSIACFRAFWKTIVMFHGVLCENFFPAFAFVIIFNSNFPLFGMPVLCSSHSMALFAYFRFAPLFAIFILTYFAFILTLIFEYLAFMKLRKWFNLFATRTGFRYDCFRHGLFLYKRLCLGRLQASPVFGSVYYTVNKGNVE